MVGKMYVVKQFSMDLETALLLKKISERVGKSQSELIREAIRKMANEIEITQ